MNDDANIPVQDDNQTQAQPQEEAGQSKQSQNFAFYTPSEVGIRETDPNKIAAAPRPQPGMTFTPSGGSVSHIQHQQNVGDEPDSGTQIITPTQQQ